MDSQGRVLACGRMRPAGPPRTRIPMCTVAGAPLRDAEDGRAPWSLRRGGTRRGPDTRSNAADAAVLEDHDA